MKIWQCASQQHKTPLRSALQMAPMRQVAIDTKGAGSDCGYTDQFSAASAASCPSHRHRTSEVSWSGLIKTRCCCGSFNAYLAVQQACTRSHEQAELQNVWLPSEKRKYRPRSSRRSLQPISNSVEPESKDRPTGNYLSIIRDLSCNVHSSVASTLSHVVAPVM